MSLMALPLEETSKGRPSDDQVMMVIKEKTGATNSTAFQQLPTDIKKSLLIELKGKRASLRQLNVSGDRFLTQVGGTSRLLQIS